MSANDILARLASALPKLSGIQPLVRGGQKQVFTADHSDHGAVVLKLMLPGSDLERVRREIETASKLRIQRMPPIFEHGVLDLGGTSWIWIVEQRVPGESLRARLKRTQVLRRDELLRLAAHIAETLAAAEAANIVHRDVKPDNIIVHSDGSFWLIDFGIARHLDMESVTATHQLGGLGTPGYAPQEQTQNRKRDIDARADLFALGVTLYEAAVGDNPHVSGGRDAIERIRRAASMSLPRLPSSFSAGFADFVATLAQPACVHRPQTAGEALVWASELCRDEGVA